MLKVLGKSQAHNVNRQTVIIFNAMCDSRLHEPLGTIYCPEAAVFLPSILENQKKNYVSFIDILEVYILISHLSQSRVCTGEEMTEKYVENNEVFI